MCSPVSAMSSTSSQQALGRGWRRLLALVCLALICAPWLVACGPAIAERPPLKVVATIAPLADWARQIGQQRVTVTQLVPLNTDPTTYVLTQADQRALREADVLLFNGLDLEPWLYKTVEQVRPPQMVSLELSQFVGPRSGGQQPVGRSQLAPDAESDDSLSQDRTTVLAQPTYSRYLWLDPGPDMAQRSVMLIADTFARADPDRLMVYRRNAEQYNGELENLDNWIRRQIRTWPRLEVGTRELLAWQSSDRSWHYFAARYGITLRTTQSLRSIEPALPETTPLLVDHFGYVADQPLTPDLRRPDAVLNPLSDQSYIQLMRRNVNVMTQGLQQAARNAGGDT